MILLYQEKKNNRTKKPSKKHSSADYMFQMQAPPSACAVCLEDNSEHDFVNWVECCFVRCSFIQNVLIVKVKGLVITLAHCITADTSSELILGQKPLYFRTITYADAEFYVVVDP